MKLVTILFLLSFTIGAGCGKKEDKPDATTKPDVKTSETVTKNGNEVSSGKLPDGFPQDIPIYKNSPLLQSSKTAKIFSTTFETSDAAKDVGDFYKAEMPKNGYKPDADNDRMSKDDKGIISFTKDGKTCDITYRYMDSKAKTTVSILVR